MGKSFKSVLIIADIEGSSGCWSRRGSSFMTDAWYRACVEMTKDVQAVVAALFDAGVGDVTVHDFHRTGYNLLSELIDPKVRVCSGYRRGPVPGIGDPGKSEAVMFLGMHAASGSDGFLAHTLTSRIKRLDVNGRLMAEVALFAGSLAPYGVRPVLFSGCPTACAQAGQAIQGIHAYPIDKTKGLQTFNVDSWRAGLAQAAVGALNNLAAEPYSPTGPFRAVVTMREGEDQAQKLANRWGFAHKGSQILIETPDIHQLYTALIKLCYMTPLLEKVLPLALFSHRLLGRFGLAMVRRHLKKNR
jgi:D-aminopeptidase